LVFCLRSPSGIGGAECSVGQKQRASPSAWEIFDKIL
jgi:hypothetical protein